MGVHFEWAPLGLLFRMGWVSVVELFGKEGVMNKNDVKGDEGSTIYSLSW